MLKIRTLTHGLPTAFLLGGSLLALSFQASADVLEMPGTAADTTVIDAPAPILPRRGISKTQVEAQYGPPITRHPAVGDPPITRWDYQGFSVFFEYQHVLHAVIPDEPKPIYNKDELQSGF